MSGNPKRENSNRKKIDKKEEVYFSNNININEFSEKMIKDLASLKIIKELLIENNFSTTKIESIEHTAFNLLINQIELEKGNATLEVGVIGSFSSGKSTFINSFFGKSICPMAMKPTTSSITKFYYGEKEKITVNGKEITQEFYHDLSQHLKGNTGNTKTHYIEYAYPFERLHSIVLYDTPGFNNPLNGNDTNVTMKTLESVDVIFVVVDISKGTIDMSSIERLHELKEKRMYCILNKSDLKSEQAILKIKNEILAKKIFLEVFEYSASKVLELGEKNYFSDSIGHIENNFLAKKEPFKTEIKGVKKEIKGRLKTRIEYKLHIDNREILIDDFYISAKKQKIRVEKMLNSVAESKQFSFQQKLKFDRHNYHEESKILMQEELNDLISATAVNKFEEFENVIEKFKHELYEFEKKNIKIFYDEWNYTFKSSCSIKDELKENKSYWSTPYTKIFFDKNKFKRDLKKMDSLKYMEELIAEWIKFFKNNYHIDFTSMNFERAIEEEALTHYSNAYIVSNHDSRLYIRDSEEIMYFEDIHEARKYLENFLKFKHKNTITIMHTFLKRNEKEIERHTRIFYAQDVERTKSINKLEKEMKQFIKEKEEYVTSLQR